MQRTGRASSISHGSSLKVFSIISHRSLLGLALAAGSQALIGIGGRATLKGIALNELLACQPELFGWLSVAHHEAQLHKKSGTTQGQAPQTYSYN